MRFVIALIAGLVCAAAACSGVDASSQRTTLSDSGIRIGKSSITMTAESGITITMRYGIEYHNHSSNKTFELWYISPLEFEVKGVSPDSQVRIVFTNIADDQELCVTRRSVEKRTTYYVDLKPRDGLMVGNLIEDGFLLGGDGKSYGITVYPPYTRRAPYCMNEQSKEQLVAVVVDGAWQTARVIERDGIRTAIAGDMHDFPLHLESY